MPKGVYPRTPKLSVTCDACGTITMRWKSDVAKGYKATFCSVACRAQYNDAATRFRRNYSPEPNGCWLWTGARYGEGYGSFWMNGKTGLAHRAAYELFVQKPPKSLAVCHRCDNKICVNPAHLFLGTRAENSADMVAKDRQAKGERFGRSMLTPEIVRLIRSSAQPDTEWAAQLGLSKGAINHIRNRRNWRHVQ